MSRKEFELACLNGDFDTIQCIISKDCHFNVANKLVALWKAIENNHFDIVKWLLNYQLNGEYCFKKTIHNHHDKIFVDVCEKSSLAMVRYLISMEDKLGQFNIEYAMIGMISFEVFDYLIHLRTVKLSPEKWYYIMNNFVQNGCIEGMQLVLSLIQTYPEIDIHYDYDSLITSVGYNNPDKKIEMLKYMLSLEPLYGKFDICADANGLLYYNLIKMLDVNGLAYYVSLDRTPSFTFSSAIGMLIESFYIRYDFSTGLQKMIYFLLHCDKCIIDNIHYNNDELFVEICRKGSIELMIYMLSLEKKYGLYNINRLFENEFSPAFNIKVFTPKLKYIIKHYKPIQLDLSKYQQYCHTHFDDTLQIRFTIFNEANDKYIANVGALPIDKILP
jgi:hypothetical protein